MNPSVKLFSIDRCGSLDLLLVIDRVMRTTSDDYVLRTYLEKIIRVKYDGCDVHTFQMHWVLIDHNTYLHLSIENCLKEGFIRNFASHSHNYGSGQVDYGVSLDYGPPRT